MFQSRLLDTTVLIDCLAQIGLASWLLLQYHHNNNSPSSSARNGVRIVLQVHPLLLFTDESADVLGIRFDACWTAVTAVLYTAFFLHPSWSQQSIASIGAQATWLLLTWILWVSGASLLNTALPSLFTGGTCITVVYCGQMQSLFGGSM